MYMKCSYLLKQKSQEFYHLYRGQGGQVIGVKLTQFIVPSRGPPLTQLFTGHSKTVIVSDQNKTINFIEFHSVTLFTGHGKTVIVSDQNKNIL